MENHSRLHDEKCKTPEPFLEKGLGQTVALFCYDSLIFTLPLESSLFTYVGNIRKQQCCLSAFQKENVRSDGEKNCARLPVCPRDSERIDWLQTAVP